MNDSSSTSIYIWESAVTALRVSSLEGMKAPFKGFLGETGESAINFMFIPFSPSIFSCEIVLYLLAGGDQLPVLLEKLDLGEFCCGN